MSVPEKVFCRHKTPVKLPAMNTPKPIFIPGPVGQLEAMTTEPAEDGQAIVGIICHPNPTQEGTMHNKVVTTIARAFEQLGLKTVRFNYRGVGQSDGAYGEVAGEIDDLKAVIAWVKAQWPDHQIWLAGFSFGCFISASVQHETQIATRLISVAPAADRHDFSALTNINVPWLVVASRADEVVPFDQVEPFLKQPPSPMTVEIFDDASHFFHGKLIPLRELLKTHLG